MRALESTFVNRRILVVDDNVAIHQDFIKILGKVQKDALSELDALDAHIFGKAKNIVPHNEINFEIDTVCQGDEAALLVKESIAEQKNYALAFIDVRMPPGWNGIETAKHLWGIDPKLQIVLCTAYSDHSWQDITQALGYNHQLLILKKPFDSIEVLQLAIALTNKWQVAREAELKQQDLEQLAETRSIEFLKAKEALHQSDQKLESIVRCSPDYILTIDQKHRVTFVNRVPDGYKIEDVLGKSIYTLLSSHLHQHVGESLNKAFETGETVHFDTVCPLDGGPLWFSNRASPLRIGDKIDALINIATDITLKKKLEENLRQSQKMEAIGRLAGGIAHDFNNLLTVILSYSTLLTETCKIDHRAEEFVHAILTASQRAAALTQQLLSFSRQQAVQAKPIELNSVINDMHQMLHRLIGEDIVLEIKLAPVNPTIVADKTQIEQIIMNLAINARDAMPSGGNLTISTAITNPDPDFLRGQSNVKAESFVMITICDTGIGMDPEVLDIAFEPFFTTKEIGKGTGLGLATVYGNVTQNKGHIKAQSEPERGTSFKIYFPLVQPVVPSTHQQPKKHKSAKAAGKETILLVEDEEAVRQVTSIILSEAGYNVVIATNGVDAIERYEPQKFENIDLVLTDVVMPKMGGKELLHRVRALRPELPMLFISGYTQNTLTDQDIGALGAHFLQKPFPTGLLLEKIRQALDSAAG